MSNYKKYTDQELIEWMFLSRDEKDDFAETFDEFYNRFNNYIWESCCRVLNFSHQKEDLVHVVSNNVLFEIQDSAKLISSMWPTTFVKEIIFKIISVEFLETLSNNVQDKSLNQKLGDLSFSKTKSTPLFPDRKTFKYAFGKLTAKEKTFISFAIFLLRVSAFENESRLNSVVSWLGTTKINFTTTTLRACKKLYAHLKKDINMDNSIYSLEADFITYEDCIPFTQEQIKQFDEEMDAYDKYLTNTMKPSNEILRDGKYLIDKPDYSKHRGIAARAEDVDANSILDDFQDDINEMLDNNEN